MAINSITYRQLAQLIEKMTDEQKDNDLTVHNGYENEYHYAELRVGPAGVVVGEGLLKTLYPVIYFNPVTGD